MAAAQLVSLGAVLLLHTFEPYADTSDGRFALLTGWQTVLIILAGQIMGLNERQTDEEREQYAVLLVALVVVTLGSGLALIAAEFGCSSRTQEKTQPALAAKEVLQGPGMSGCAKVAPDQDQNQQADGPIVAFDARRR
ncbi:MAG: hypothetical protein VXW31_05540, partial [Planctomycetota bacterium]|nr:hypothetical protein [Planctomycetota bacterium]